MRSETGFMEDEATEDGKYEGGPSIEFTLIYFLQCIQNVEKCPGACHSSLPIG